MKPACLAAIAILLLGACAAPGETPATVRVFDLGIDAPAAVLRGARLGRISAAPPHDGFEISYRLGHVNPAERHTYALSRWSAPPAELLRARLLRALAPGEAGCVLDLELIEFGQVFRAPGTSEALLELRARLGGAARAERTLRIIEPGAGGSAEAGVLAMTRATDRALAEIAGWLTALPACRA